MTIIYEHNRPTACESRAYEYVRNNLLQIESTTGLLRCALGVAMHAMEDLDPESVQLQIKSIAGDIRSRASHRRINSLVAHLHTVLFDEMKFHVARGEYFYHPLSSYFPAVLSSRQGIPVSLALIYKAVASELGLEVRGIAGKGRFFVEVFDGEAWILVDVCQAGRKLTPADAGMILKRLDGGTPPDPAGELRVSSHRVWLKRMVVNLAYVFQTMGRMEDYAAMHDLLQLMRNDGFAAQSFWN